MKAIKGPAVFLAQFAGDAPPFNTLPAIAGWAAGLGFKGVQIPTWDRRLFDLERAADSQTYCDEVKGTLAERGLQVTELSTHLQGQLVAVHPAYDTAFDGFAALEVRGKPQARAAWAVTSAVISCTIPAISCCSSSTTSRISTSITSGSACSTSRTPSSTRPAAKVCTVGSSPGRCGPDGSARWATAR